MTIPLAPNPRNHLFGKGSLYLARFAANGTRGPYYHLGNCDQFQITPAVQKAQLRSSMDESNALLNEVVTQTDFNFSIRGFDYATKNVALALLGDDVVLAQAGGTVTDEVLTSSVVQGGLYRTAQRDISAVTVERGPAPGTAMVLGTDWELVDAQAGLIRILPTSPALADGDTVLVTYTAGAIVDRPRVRGGVTPQIEGTLLYVPRNLSGPKWQVELFRASFAAEGALDFISDNFSSFTLSGSVLDDSAGLYGGSTANPFFQLVSRT